MAHDVPAEGLPLGAARAQVHENYIVAQTETGMVIVDQHAAHERLVYEKLKRQMAENGVAAQALLIPEIVELSEGDCARIMTVADELSKLGLTIEAFGGGAVAVRETPALLGEVNARAMVLDILDELDDAGESMLVQAKLEAILSRVACHGSIRSGRRMRGGGGGAGEGGAGEPGRGLAAWAGKRNWWGGRGQPAQTSRGGRTPGDGCHGRRPGAKQQCGPGRGGDRR